MDEDDVVFRRNKYKQNEVHFIPPPEAPVFEPSWQEFEDPISYINKIKPTAEKYGVCKIRPPPEWQPPFALDIENFKFTPRLQRLNELEAKTRIKLNFLDQIAKFWELQGCTLKIPMVERRILDLYSLHQVVAEEGGFYEVSKTKNWLKVASKMGYLNPKMTHSLLKTHYERILYPYDVFKERELNDKKVNLQLQRLKDIKEEAVTENNSSASMNCEKKHNIFIDSDDSTALTYHPSTTGKRELNRLTFYGTGSKMVGIQSRLSRSCSVKHSARRRMTSSPDPLAKYVCKNCIRGDVEESMLLCDGCDDSYHTFCLKPPLADVPKGDWRCPKCVANEVKKPLEAFGFEQAQQEYTLHQFGEMADRFKSDYFNMPVHRVPTSLVEKEFWRLVSSIDENVCVEYGADLHSVEHGSGFPTKRTSNLDEDPSLKAYIESGWNLNNIPVLEDSVLSFINADISGMKVPWMYVGMCFSTFCWHNEDHWSYSINYLHWGEPKTWYGVPGSHADLFENSMKAAAPELFENQPDLLHQLVTILNPNIVMKAGVPVYRTDQQAGEFVITFPRAYHAGFNQGYNFAEAVNFAPVDWLKMGRECINYYSSLRRYCVFSHDELVCKMAMDAENLHPKTAAATYEDTIMMVESEKKLRKTLLDWGVCDAERQAFELLPDDERQCEVCKTTCFLSAVSCSCNSSQLVCLRHFQSLCGCPPKKHVLRYRYSLDEIPVMLQKLKDRSESYESWLGKSKTAIKLEQDDRLALDAFKNLVIEASEGKYPTSHILNELTSIVQEADQLSCLSSKLLEKRKKPRKCYLRRCQLSYQELCLFFSKINDLPCIIPELQEIKSWVADSEKNSQDLKMLLVENSTDVQKLTMCWLDALSLGLKSADIDLLRERLSVASWLNWANDMISGNTIYELFLYDRVIKEASTLPENDHCEPICLKLKKKLSSIKNWEERVKQVTSRTRGNVKIEVLEELKDEGSKFNVSFPFLEQFFCKVTSIRNSLTEAETFLNSKEKFKLSDLKEVVNKLDNLTVTVPLLTILQKKITDVDLWIKETSDLFAKESSKIPLIEVLCPQIDERLNSKKVSKDITPSKTNILRFIEELKNGVASEKLLELNMDAKRDQINNLKSIQLLNIRKKLNAKKTSEFCICNKQLQGLMYECSLCRDWFHETCVAFIKHLKTQSDSYGFDVHFICKLCVKSKRPTIKETIKLLLKLERLKIIFPEGEALKLLFERLIFVRSRFKEVLAMEEVKQAEKKFSIHKCPKDVNKDTLFDDEFEPGIKWKLNTILPTVENQSNPNLPIRCPTEMDHDYSAGGGIVQDNLKKHHRKSPIKHREFEEFDDEKLHVMFSKATVLELKELFNEGGLLELKFNENQIIWRFLQASVPHKVHHLFKSEETVMKKKVSDNQFKRKKSTECSINKKIKLPAKENDGSKTKKGTKQVKETKKQTNSKEKADLCAAERCNVPPKGKKIDWVQCDGPCNLWFHMTCVGLEKKHLKKNDDYFCPMCKIIA